MEYIKSRLQTWFSLSQDKIYCQVSTLANKTPHIRTMDLYDITEEGHLIFLTETSTRKWLDLQTCQNIAVCILHLEFGQIIVEGKAILNTASNDFESASIYWHKFLDQYWRDFYLSRSSNSIEKIPTSFGVIHIEPCLWEILEINKEDFLKSSRKKFQLVDGSWIIQDLLLV